MQFSPKSIALFRQFIHFAAVGLSGTLVQYLSLWIGVEYFLMAAAVASAIGYILGSVVNYLLNYFFTFSSGKSHKEAASKYFSVIGIGWCLNFLLMSLFVKQLGWYYWFAQIITTGIGLLWNFSGSKWWAFKHKPT
ncbi:GtrA family protein [Solimicrobium silvestre]|uniref:GtrA-like protein n=1 Tax=Solimicrobium silvestre TaxID=2099400 RepID=A0A2S9GVC9_9BURK|nr:GtrA family protein [Solimicrobium silvestre]PRC91677.1 GtrA-like protein [Solimicrobium silvestre]